MKNSSPLGEKEGFFGIIVIKKKGKTRLT